MKVVVLSDTHSPRRWKSMPPEVAKHLVGADAILHAGDVCTVDVLVELSGFAPVSAVFGNNDLPEVAEWGAPESLELVLGGLRVAMIHDSGPAAGRGRRMRSRFPAADLVVFGHSHIPMDLSPLDPTGAEVHLFNPGSPTDRRRQPAPTLGLLDIRDGQLSSARIIAVS